MSVQQTGTIRPGTFDARAGAVHGLATAAWYTVPDLVERRGTRALLKAASGVAGLAVLLRTEEGRQAVEGVRKVRDTVRGVALDAPDDALPDLTPVEIAPAGKAALVAAAVVLVGTTTALAVAGEKAAYRWGERMRARGVRAPHLRVGLVLGVASAVLGGLSQGAGPDEQAHPVG